VTLCGQCKKAEARVVLTYQQRCTTQSKPLCADCARTSSVPYPFTLKDLRPPRTK